MIKAESLSRSVAGKRILEGVNLEIQKGEIFTVIGPSGDFLLPADAESCCASWISSMCQRRAPS